jgi:hypothetical protein
VRACIGCGTEIPYNASLQQKRCKENCGRPTPHKARDESRARHDVNFVAVDGEGVTYCAKCQTVKEDSLTCHCGGTKWLHDYVLITVGDNEPLFNEDGSHLYWEEIFDYLYECFLKAPNAAYVGFFLGYDFTQWLRSLSERYAFQLLNSGAIAKRKRKKSGGNRMPFPVYVANDDNEWAWEIDTLSMKTFRLRPGTGENPGTKNRNKFMVICDSGPFFQSSFLSVIESHIGTLITQEEYDAVLAGKENRSTAKLDADMIRYNALENNILSRVMRQLNEGFSSVGVRLRNDHWYGPGAAAQQWLTNINAPTAKELKEIIPRYAFETAQKTYYGGWFEIFRHGHIPGETYEYDLNSAYPYAIANLPCLLHGTWTHEDAVSALPDLPEGSLRMLFVHVRGSNKVIGPLPHRTTKGRVLRPHETKGWYWEHEINAAILAGLINEIDVKEYVQYDPCDCPKPFRSIAELYQKRLRVGKNTPSGKAYKLVYNSAYGKMAQSIGEPKYANSIYASLITSNCRTRILEAIATHENGTDAVLMVATDGVYFDTPHTGLELDKEKLGAWDETVKHNMCLFMPGVYWDDKSRQDLAEGKTVRVKSRGVAAKDLSACITSIDEQFRTMTDEWPSLKVPILFNMTSAKLALARGKWHTAGEVILDGHRIINATPASKRVPVVYTKDGTYRTNPYTKGAELETTPYDKSFGLELETFMIGDAEITPDGTINLAYLLNG